MRMFLLKPLLSAILKEASAGEDAEALGLTHKGWGRYYDDEGNLVAKSVKGKLVKVDPNDDENHDSDYRDAEDQLNADPESPRKMASATAAFASGHHKDDPEQVQKLKRMQKVTGILRKMKDNGAEWDHLSPEAQKSLKRISKQLAKDKEFKAGYPKSNDTNHKVLDWEKEERKARSMTSDQLAYAIKDAIAARDASGRDNPNGEGYYQDQASTYAKELKARRDGTAQEPLPTSPSIQDFMKQMEVPPDDFSNDLANAANPPIEPTPEPQSDRDAWQKMMSDMRSKLKMPEPLSPEMQDLERMQKQQRAAKVFDKPLTPKPELTDFERYLDATGQMDKAPRFKDLAPDKYDDPEAERQSKEDDDYNNNPSRFGPDR